MVVKLLSFARVLFIVVWVVETGLWLFTDSSLSSVNQYVFPALMLWVIADAIVKAARSQ
ncbi:hypothetical protein [Mycobacteroides abscessus]|uniref:Transmembrane protein n=1 Tax=Mycobacteroides abscessus subsp. massiliense TaxID=1962118 RepID=A0A1U0YAZ5_9MYCO|nr:hypothetical protein [Mycobacteroides abscessus]SKL37543.1 Uncharacterised protein [Mycobacteroides abscessus subsp. massiliense]SKS56431.1 Uncharacterised protein [Mycobacteroides abscessus subsp. massiliense]SKT51417.1 Uncharacterised protein [Mycobacteroides abscessus subsp. massiliense]SKX00431.1 Uncharacterised protein [Mycobacteroides abscessus subsp. massiliense]